ncbi:hypothetical protein ZHAS_00019028 [Anopheles sinensis]|uniref:Uncharacterized protein n=1 Tax=Anopheles sinensis TaxID=74873 RepID=A0A084WL90_ANOSI|nr:hypothetical protein ZHAS_00019028 [Anopheles sinensis]
MAFYSRTNHHATATLITENKKGKIKQRRAAEKGKHAYYGILSTAKIPSPAPPPPPPPAKAIDGNRCSIKYNQAKRAPCERTVVQCFDRYQFVYFDMLSSGGVWCLEAFGTEVREGELLVVYQPRISRRNISQH